jgi:hypothetical protein
VAYRNSYLIIVLLKSCNRYSLALSVMSDKSVCCFFCFLLSLITEVYVQLLANGPFHCVEVIVSDRERLLPRGTGRKTTAFIANRHYERSRVNSAIHNNPLSR